MPAARRGSPAARMAGRAEPRRRLRLQPPPAPHAGQQRHDEDHDEDEEQNLGDIGSRAGDAEESERAGNQRDDEKTRAQYGMFPSGRRSTRTPFPESQQAGSRCSSGAGAGMKPGGRAPADRKRKAPAAGPGLFGSRVGVQKPKRRDPTISCVSKSPVRVGKPVTTPPSALPPWK